MPNLHNGSSHCNMLRLDDYTYSVKSHMAGDHSSWRSKGTQRYSGVLWGCRTEQLGGLLKLIGANLPATRILNGSIQWSQIWWWYFDCTPPWAKKHGGCICCWPAAGVSFGRGLQLCPFLARIMSNSTLDMKRTTTIPIFPNSPAR